MDHFRPEPLGGHRGRLRSGGPVRLAELTRRAFTVYRRPEADRGAPTTQPPPDENSKIAKRAELIADLAAHVRRDANEDSTPPVWATPGSQPSVALIGEVEVWRAANAIDRKDHRPTGAGQLQTRPPSGSNTSTEVFRTAATTSVGRMPEPTKLAENIAGTKINNACASHLPPARARRPAPGW